MTKLATKISLSNFAPKSYLGIMYPKDNEGGGPNAIYLGSVIGTATGVKNSFGQDGVTPVAGAKGNFAIDFAPTADGELPEGIGSGVLYLPEAFMDPMLALFEPTFKVDADGKQMLDGDNKPIVDRPAAKAIDVAYDVAIVKAGNAAKYSWQLTPLLQQASDPVAAVRLQIAKQREATQAKIAADKAAPQISDQSAATGKNKK